MPRRARVVRRLIPPDAKYQSRVLAQFINKLMMRGKKALAEGLVYRAFELMEEQARRPPLELFEQAVQNATPVLQVKARRVGGATYQVPIEIRGERRTTLAMRWILQAARARKGRPMSERLAAELLDASHMQGAAVKRREDTHRMAEANRAFVHYRW